jgi:hypothetical protein
MVQRLGPAPALRPVAEPALLAGARRLPEPRSRVSAHPSDGQGQGEGEGPASSPPRRADGSRMTRSGARPLVPRACGDRPLALPLTGPSPVASPPGDGRRCVPAQACPSSPTPPCRLPALQRGFGRQGVASRPGAASRIGAAGVCFLSRSAGPDPPSSASPLRASCPPSAHAAPWGLRRRLRR